MNVIYLLVILIPAFISTMFIPYWTRRTESFGVSIPEDVYHADNIKQLRKKYVIYSGIASLILTIVFLLLGSTNMDDTTLSLYFSGLVFIYLFATFLIYLYFHRIMKQLKQQENWSKEKSQATFVKTDFRSKKLNHSNLWFTISFIITFAMIALTFINYDKIPEKIPMQYNFDGEITNWATKSERSVLMMPIMSLYLTLLFMFLNTMIAKAKQQISAERPEESLQQNIIFRRRWSAFLIGTGLGTTILLSFMQLSLIYPVNQQLMTIVPMIFALIITVWAIILSVTTGQGGSRVKISMGANGEVINRDEDKYWKLGVFYFNPKDPALFLEKRFGVGWTINLGRPMAWVFFIGIIAIAVGIPYLLGM
ncbi:DUF1648 domain-containing protein [Ornithinibacillus halotolerans]|uniref:Membrane protein n=1 Tax=Ornithinibacillus halotolerans TaxID=1274357 RepID=A0A916WD88_9BACI|nr:DUF5808 domain-containing protein [Ornithinibacillus halotolerans]GGA89231.1 membrane protein [Ornithinibacillus halotolerans]